MYVLLLPAAVDMSAVKCCQFCIECDMLAQYCYKVSWKWRCIFNHCNWQTNLLHSESNRRCCLDLCAARQYSNVRWQHITNSYINVLSCTG